MKFTITNHTDYVQLNFGHYASILHRVFDRTIQCPLKHLTEVFGEPQQELLSEDEVTTKIWCWRIDSGDLVVSLQPNPNLTKFILEHSN